MKNIFILISLFSFGLILTGCGKQAETCSITNNFSCWTTWETLQHTEFTGTVNTVLLALKNQDLVTLSTFVSEQWLRFSPYEYVNTWTDIVLTTWEIYNWLALSRSFIRWTYDGKGNPIDLWIGQYFEKFVNDADYMNAPVVLYNQSTQRGNTINNIGQVYQGKQWVEYYFSWFDAQYEGMDRKSLTLVFEQENGQRYLIGIVHGQWTI